jgi:hypothetical protein
MVCIIICAQEFQVGLHLSFFPFASVIATRFFSVASGDAAKKIF